MGSKFLSSLGKRGSPGRRFPEVSSRSRVFPVGMGKEASLPFNLYLPISEMYCELRKNVTRKNDKILIGIFFEK